MITVIRYGLISDNYKERISETKLTKSETKLTTLEKLFYDILSNVLAIHQCVKKIKRSYHLRGARNFVISE